MVITVMGFEVLYFFYPYTKEKKKVRNYAFLGNLLSTLAYLYLMLLSIGFFSAQELEKNVWVSLNLFKVVHFPFLEQFQVIIISLVLILVAPNCITYLWLCSKGVKKIFGMKQKYAVYLLSVIFLLASLFFYKRPQINDFNKVVQAVMAVMAFIYPFFLFIYTKVYFRLKKNKEKST